MKTKQPSSQNPFQVHQRNSIKMKFSLSVVTLAIMALGTGAVPVHDGGSGCIKPASKSLKLLLGILLVLSHHLIFQAHPNKTITFKSFAVFSAPPRIAVLGRFALAAPKVTTSASIHTKLFLASSLATSLGVTLSSLAARTAVSTPEPYIFSNPSLHRILPPSTTISRIFLHFILSYVHSLFDTQSHACIEN